MPTWRAAALVSTAFALSVAAACSSFESGDDAAPIDASADGGGDAIIEPPAEGGEDAARPPRIHVFGGYTDNMGLVVADDAWSAEILADGGLGAWTATPELVSSRYFAANTFTTTGRIVSAGGSRRTDASAAFEPTSKSVDTASLDPLTTLTAAAPLEFVVQSAAATSRGPFVYVTGGLSSQTITRNEVFVSSFDEDGKGALLTWKKTAPLGASTARHAVVALGDFLYSAGGSFADDGGFTAVAETWRARIAGDGTLDTWTATGSLPEAVTFHALVAVKGHLYSIGGRLATAPTSNVHVATPNADGDLTWAPSTPLPTPLAAACALVENERIYVTGGFSAPNAPPGPKVYVGTVGDGGGLSWSEPVGADLPTARGGHGCAAF
jgi:hypothetical protein